MRTTSSHTEKMMLLLDAIVVVLSCCCGGEVNFGGAGAFWESDWLSGNLGPIYLMRL